MKCKIYFIQCLETGEVYIGSTKNKKLCKRIGDHKCKRNCSCIQILDRDKYVYDVLEEIDESQRYIREQYYIETTDNCINERRAYTELKGKEYDKQYYLDNKDKLKEYKNQKYTCECGQILSLQNKSKHKKSKRHQEYLKNNC